MILITIFFFNLQGKIAHAVVMPSVTVEKLDDFVKELIQARKNAFPDRIVIVPCIVEEIGAENCACSLHQGSATTKTSKERKLVAPSAQN